MRPYRLIFIFLSVTLTGYSTLLEDLIIFNWQYDLSHPFTLLPKYPKTDLTVSNF